jgi:hypothetical protein
MGKRKAQPRGAEGSRSRRSRVKTLDAALLSVLTLAIVAECAEAEVKAAH